MLDYKTKCSILSDLWENYRDDEEFKSFIEYNDIGLPLAYFLSEGLVNEITDAGQLYVNESFLLFIAALDIEERDIPEGTSLDKLLEMAQKKQEE